VEQEATDELVCIERHHLALVVGAIILPAEADAAILAGEQTAVADCDAMGVAAEIVEDERALGVDDPFDIAERRQIARESRRLAQAGESAEELQLAALERRLQALQEQAPVLPRENADGRAASFRNQRLEDGKFRSLAGWG
jgi:hypothetical protein